MPQVLCMKIDEQVDLLVKKIGHKLLFKKKNFRNTNDLPCKKKLKFSICNLFPNWTLIITKLK